MLKKILLSVLTLCLITFTIQNSSAHCEIPCGIYGDEMRIKMIEEHVSTIEKSMKMIRELSTEQTINYNQLVRWINNKEKHANEIQHIVTQYFMTQRLKPAKKSEPDKQKRYAKQLSMLHEMLIYAMKSKQTTDIENIAKLKGLLHEFADLYFGERKKAHK